MSDPPSRFDLSLVVVAHDAGRDIGDCLSSAGFASEAIVVDSGSRDDTVETARRCGARVIQQAWLGFGPQKTFAVAAARHDWVLCVDTDERVSPELAEAIQREMRAPRCAAYAMARRNRFLGRWLRHGEGYPDWQLRLFDRRRAHWSDDVVHEHVIAEGPIGRLAGDLLHDSAESLDAYLAKQNRYTTLQAEALHALGRRASALRMVVSPLSRFLRFYVLRLGFLDGSAGLAHIAIGAFASFLKHAKLFALERGQEMSGVGRADAAGERAPGEARR